MRFVHYFMFVSSFHRSSLLSSVFFWVFVDFYYTTISWQANKRCLMLLETTYSFFSLMRNASSSFHAGHRVSMKWCAQQRLQYELSPFLFSESSKQLWTVYVHTTPMPCVAAVHYSVLVVWACLTVMHTVWPLFAYVLKTVRTQWGVKTDPKWLKYQNKKTLASAFKKYNTRTTASNVRTENKKRPPNKTVDRHFKLVKRQSKSLVKIVYSFPLSLSLSFCLSFNFSFG